MPHRPSTCARASSRSGFNVDVACNGRDALGLVLRQEYCLVVLEFEIAGMGGRALLASLREQVGTPVMVVTRSHSLEDQVFCLKNGADDYLVKPVRLPEFLAGRACACAAQGRQVQAAPG